MKLTKKQITSFQKQVLDHYHRNGRVLPWRKTKKPYHVLVSEIMLQQTQVDRVIPKYKKFICAFPNFKKLAQASLRDVLKAWSGLGYNRRAKYLLDSAKIVDSSYHGRLPKEPSILETLPGIGKNTAGSIAAFAYDLPIPFIETNIRAVFIHHFFKNKKSITDNEILGLVEQTMYLKSPRIWYNALMDYGSYLKTTNPNPSRKSKHHTRQKPFKGSNREIRGTILKTLKDETLTKKVVCKKIPFDDERIIINLEKLIDEQLISYEKGKYHLG